MLFLQQNPEEMIRKPWVKHGDKKVVAILSAADKVWMLRAGPAK